LTEDAKKWKKLLFEKEINDRLEFSKKNDTSPNAFIYSLIRKD